MIYGKDPDAVLTEERPRKRWHNQTTDLVKKDSSTQTVASMFSYFNFSARKRMLPPVAEWSETLAFKSHLKRWVGLGVTADQFTKMCDLFFATYRGTTPWKSFTSTAVRDRLLSETSTSGEAFTEMEQWLLNDLVYDENLPWTKRENTETASLVLRFPGLLHLYPDVVLDVVTKSSGTEAIGLLEDLLILVNGTVRGTERKAAVLRLQQFDVAVPKSLHTASTVRTPASTLISAITLSKADRA